MSFMNLFWAADWDGLYYFMTRGNPPLILQLMIVNTVFFSLYVVRRVAGKHQMRKRTLEVLQGVLLLANIGVVMQDTVWAWMNSSIVQKLI